MITAAGFAGGCLSVASLFQDFYLIVNEAVYPGSIRPENSSMPADQSSNPVSTLKKR